MPRKPKVKTDQVHRILIPDLESYSNVVSQKPYIYMKRPLLQNVICENIIQANLKGHKHLQLIYPIECLAESYQRNPPQFALVIRRCGGPRLPDDLKLSVRIVPAQTLQLNEPGIAPDTLFAVITTSDKPHEVRWGLLGKIAQQFYGKPLGYSIVVQSKDVAPSYFEHPRFLAYHTQQHLRKQLNNPDIQVVAHRLGEGIRVSTVPAPDPEN